MIIVAPMILNDPWIVFIHKQLKGWEFNIDTLVNWLSLNISSFIGANIYRQISYQYQIISQTKYVLPTNSCLVNGALKQKLLTR